MSLRVLAVVVLMLTGLLRSLASGGPLSLDEQRKLAEKHGFKVEPGPDSAQPADPSPKFSDESVRAGAAAFVRDYNLPIYPDSKVGQAELDAPAVIEAARGEAEPLSLGVRALEDLEGLTVAIGPLAGPNGAVLPADGLRVRYLEAAYIQSPTRARRQPAGQAVLASLRLRPVEPLPLVKGVNRQFWIDVAIPADAAAGEYRGQIAVRCTGRPELKRALTVRVHPFELAQPKDFFFGAFMSQRINPNRRTLADLKAHGIDGMLWFWHEQTNWLVRREGETIRQDFSPITRMLDDAVAVGMKGPVVVALGNDHKGYYERRLCQLFGRPLRPAEEVGGKTAEVPALDDELINRLYVEGIRQLVQYTRTRKDWPEIVLLHYDEATERLMPEAAHRYKLIKEASPATRVYGVTMSKLAWAEQVAPISDILVCNGDFSAIRDLGRKLNKDVWGYGGAPAVIGAGGARFNMGLRLWRYRLGSHWFWCYDFFPASPWNEFDGRTGAANWVTVYPADARGEHIPTLAWEGIREGHDDIRYLVTLDGLLARAKGPVRDRIAAGRDQFLRDIPEGRDRTVFRADQDDFYATLPSYNRLTAMRRQLAEWIEQLLPLAGK